MDDLFCDRGRHPLPVLHLSNGKSVLVISFPCGCSCEVLLEKSWALMYVEIARSWSDGKSDVLEAIRGFTTRSLLAENYGKREDRFAPITTGTVSKYVCKIGGAVRGATRQLSERAGHAHVAPELIESVRFLGLRVGIAGLIVRDHTLAPRRSA